MDPVYHLMRPTVHNITHAPEKIIYPFQQAQFPILHARRIYYILHGYLLSLQRYIRSTGKFPPYVTKLLSKHFQPARQADRESITDTKLLSMYQCLLLQILTGRHKTMTEY